MKRSDRLRGENKRLKKKRPRDPCNSKKSLRDPWFMKNHSPPFLQVKTYLSHIPYSIFIRIKKFIKLVNFQLDLEDKTKRMLIQTKKTFKQEII